jgi:hypothetical protein
MPKPKSRPKFTIAKENRAVARKLFDTLGYEYRPEKLGDMLSAWNRIMKQLVPNYQKVDASVFQNPLLNASLLDSANILDNFAAELQARFADAQPASAARAADAIRNTPLPDLLAQNNGIRGLESVVKNAEAMQQANKNKQTPGDGDNDGTPAPTARQQGANLLSSITPDWLKMGWNTATGVADQTKNIPQPMRDAIGTGASVTKNWLTGDMASHLIPGFTKAIGADQYTFPVTQSLYNLLAGGEEEALPPPNQAMQNIYDNYEYTPPAATLPRSLSVLSELNSQPAPAPAPTPSIEASPLYRAMQSPARPSGAPGKLVIPKYLKAQPIGETGNGNY